MAKEGGVKEGGRPGFRAGDKDSGVEISEEGWSKLLGTVERLWDSFLAWSERNPALFVILLLVMLMAFWVFRHTGVQKAQFRAEFEATRKSERDNQQQQLPFDESPGGPGAND